MINFSFGHELNCEDHDSQHGEGSRRYHQFILR